MSGLFDGTPLERPVTCATCLQPLKACRCPRNAAGDVLLPRDQAVRVRRERRRGGKTVTVITGLDPVAFDLKALLKELKSTCAAGGAVVDESVEIQGDHRERIVELMKARGFAAKAAGG